MSLLTQVSPGINIREVDLTNYIPNVKISSGAIVGEFSWGPMDYPLLISTEKELEQRFFPPINTEFRSFAATSFLSAANFLAYPGADLWVVRATVENAVNSTSAEGYPVGVYTAQANLTSYASEGNSNDTIYFANTEFNTANIAPGMLIIGNNVISLIEYVQYTSNTINVTINPPTSANVANTDIFDFYWWAAANTVLIRNEIDYENQFLNVNSENLYGSFAARYPGSLGDSIGVSVCSDSIEFADWAFKYYFSAPPRTSQYAAINGSANDEMHIVVYDTTGKISGTKNTVLEKFTSVSKAIDGIDVSGLRSYYKQVLFNNSKYIYSLDHIDYTNTIGNWGGSVRDLAEFVSLPNYYVQLNNGSNGRYDGPNTASILTGWDNFANKDSIEINLCITADSSSKDMTIPQYLIDTIIDGQNLPIQGRRDSMVFISPRYEDVVNQRGREARNIVDNFLVTLQRQSSYAVVDSGWKYQLDKWNNIYRWVPLNADIAGLCAQTDLMTQPWYSPAGFSRGNIKNALKLAWNPNQAERDLLYTHGVNPVVSFTGSGIVLFGDKTLQMLPSAFDRINVRRLFILLEKAISKAALSSLFEINDTFTRAQFVAMVEPYLRDIKSKRGIYDYLVVCDSTNNTPQVIDSNSFVGDIYIKPAKSINFIQLNFVAVKSGVEFSTVVGQF